MKIVCSALCGLFVGIIFSFLFFNNGINKESTVDIDKEIDACKYEISKIDTELSKYSGGLYCDLLKMQKAVYEETIAALGQKRIQLVHLIKFNYEIKNSTVFPLGDVSQCELEISKLKEEIQKGFEESSQYAPCLVKSLIDTRVATEQFTLSGLQRARIAYKFGLPILLFSQERTGQSFEAPVKQSPEMDSKAL